MDKVKFGHYMVVEHCFLQKDLLIVKYYDWKADSKGVRRCRDLRRAAIDRATSSRPVRLVAESRPFLRAQWWWWDHIRPPAPSHLGCYGYPNCDLAPLGCHYATENPEPYGHRD